MKKNRSNNSKFKLLIALIITISSNVNAYIDPATGSMIFQALIASFMAFLFILKTYWGKIKNYFGEIRSKDKDNNNDY